MNAKHVLAMLLLTLGSIGSLTAQSSLTITFDGPPSQPPGTQYGVADYSEAGVLFTPLVDPYQPGSQVVRSGGGNQGTPENGTAYVQSGAQGMTFWFSDSSLFGLRSFDLAAYSDVVPDIVLHITGFHQDGTTVTADFGGTGIEWRTVQFGSEWSSGLTRVEIPGNTSWSMDNLVLIVPEPASGALLVVGAGTVFFFRRKPVRRS